MKEAIFKLAREAGHTTSGQTIAALEAIIARNQAYLKRKKKKHQHTTRRSRVKQENQAIAAAIVWIEFLRGE